MDPRAVLDAVVKKIPSPRRESNPRTPIVQPVVIIKLLVTIWAAIMLLNMEVFFNGWSEDRFRSANLR
jgi:hypothetical protein